MLLNLHVKNLALIDEADIDLGEGLGILTGETGAGKSVLIGSILLALGAKASKEMIGRHGDYASVEALFSVSDELREELSTNFDLEFEGNQLLISRKISDTKNIMRINGETVTTTLARQVTAYLIDVHGQHEHQSLIYPAKHLEILDKYSKNSSAEALKKVSSLYSDYRAAQKELESFCLNEDERLRSVSFLEYEIQEIENANIHDGEDEELEQKYRRLNNSQKIAEHVGYAKQCIDDGREGALNFVSSAYKELEAAAAYDDISGLVSQISDIEGLLSDLNRDLASYLGDLEFDNEEFEEISSRLDLINNLKAKHGGSIASINARLAQKKSEYEKLTDYEVSKAAAGKKVQELKSKLDKACEELSAIRKKAAIGLGNEITAALKELNFLSVDFKIDFQKEKEPSSNGYDFVEFLISVNPGEKPLPLSKVASGGELSRIMLAIKTVLADKDEIETLIFDEIDTGISGITAQMVARKLKEISKSRQVICITHLAQIAAMADKHFEISKNASGDGTLTSIRELDNEGSVMELARLLGGSSISDAVITSARELKAEANKI